MTLHPEHMAEMSGVDLEQRARGKSQELGPSLLSSSFDGLKDGAAALFSGCLGLENSRVGRRQGY